MRIRFDISLREPLLLPISYQYILQSVIFHALLDDEKYAHFIHNEGVSNGNRNFKLFTFGPLDGPHKVIDKNIMFYDHIIWEIRSIYDVMGDILCRAADVNGFEIYGQNIPSSWISIDDSDRDIETDEIRVRMISPVVAYSTDPETRKTLFYSPEETSFTEQVKANFRHKYSAFFGMDPGDGFDIQTVAVSRHEKVVTRYKGFYITGWKGIYHLEGEPEYLDFLYHAGIGAKNSQGFGMFEVLS